MKSFKENVEDLHRPFVSRSGRYSSVTDGKISNGCRSWDQVRRFDDSGRPDENQGYRAEVSPHMRKLVYAHTHTYYRNVSLLPTWIASLRVLRVCVCCVALFALLCPAIHRRVWCTRPKERHAHSENRRVGQAKKKSYPEWREDGYSARKLEIDGGSERARERETL